MNVLYCFFLSLKNFQFCSVGPTPVGPSEHPIGTDGTIPYYTINNKQQLSQLSMMLSQLSK